MRESWKGGGVEKQTYSGKSCHKWTDWQHIPHEEHAMKTNVKNWRSVLYSGLGAFASVTLLVVSGAAIADTFCPPNVTSATATDLIVNGFCVVTAPNVTGDITVV